jgi:hypothetical protein
MWTFFSATVLLLLTSNEPIYRRCPLEYWRSNTPKGTSMRLQMDVMGQELTHRG